MKNFPIMHNKQSTERTLCIDLVFIIETLRSFVLTEDTLFNFIKKMLR